MQKLKIEFENCYWIKKLSHEFEFFRIREEKGVEIKEPVRSVAIYAPNGTMKTSFAKTFQRLQNGKEPEEKIHGATPVCNVTIDGSAPDKDEIFVIKSYEASYQSKNMAELLVSDEIRSKLGDVFSKKTALLKELEKLSGLSLAKGSKNLLDLESQLISDFSWTNNGFLSNIETIDLNDFEVDFSRVSYSDIFDLEDKIKEAGFQGNIRDYMDQSVSIYSSYWFFEKGTFTLSWLRKVTDTLKSEKFFVRSNRVVIGGEAMAEDELKSKLEEIEGRLKTTDPFKAINKTLSTAGGIKLKNIIEATPEILDYLSTANLGKLRLSLWKSYFLRNSALFEDLKNSYISTKAEIESGARNDTLWEEALSDFNRRFVVPFQMDIENKESVIMGENVPQVVFTFFKDGNKGNRNPSNIVKLNRGKLDESETLSQWEKRALYLLNIIFDIKARKKSWKSTIFVIDDVADSFDYKNKYAIVEYLKEIANETFFRQVILTHNFDFFRTVQSRLLGDGNMKSCYVAERNDNEIRLEPIERKNLLKPFKGWKTNIKNNKKFVIALIPFVRNLIEYWKYNKADFSYLTKLLHFKADTPSITFGSLKTKYGNYIWANDFWNIPDTDLVYDSILSIANWISGTDVLLEDKVVLAMAVRLKAEEFMTNALRAFPETIQWDGGSGCANDFFTYLESALNQTPKLFEWYIQCSQEKIQALRQVQIMTPENIHLNSFMYEPILDMWTDELKNLYLEFVPTPR